MLKIAYFSPLNPVKSGISDYSEELLPYLAQEAEVALFVDGYQPTNPEIVKNFPIHDVRQLDLKDHLSGYDIALYHMGNSPAHGYIYAALLEWPGVVVLHDYCLHHLLVHHFIEGGQLQKYIEEMRYYYGQEGVLLAKKVLATPGFYPWEQEPLRYSLNKRVIDSARGIIVHSRFVESLLRAEHPDSFVRQVNHHVIPEGTEEISAAERMALRRKHGIPLEAVVIGSFGFINAEKRLEQVLQALSLLRDLFPLFCLFVGEALIDTRRLQEATRRLGLTDRVKWTGFVDLITFRELAALADICINLRFPTMGETSGSLCRLLAAGKPCIVSYAGWFAELPDSCVVKVGVHTHEVEELANAVWELIIDEPRRLQLGRDARAYVQRHHRIEDAARVYLEFCQEMHEREKGWIEQSLASECAEVLNDIGVREIDSDLSMRLGEALYEVAGP